MDKTAEDLKLRTRRFCVAILDFVDTISRTPSGDAVARQLARSGLGVAGNYRGACRGRSHAEFTARLGVVLEEADESGQLCAIFSKACTTARIREHARK